MSVVLVVALVAGPALYALAVTVIALVAWPRGQLGAGLPGRVAVLVPARDEARSIEEAVHAALTQGADEVVVYDDQSRDGTGAIVDRIARIEPRLRRVEGSPLPAGWVGKAHACARLAEATSADWLVYVDADVMLEPRALQRVAHLVRTLGADLVTAVPRQQVVGWAEQLVVPLLHLIYASWLPAPLVWLSRDPRMTMANGQLLAIRRDALVRLGGWDAVRSELVEDMALATRAKRMGLRVVFADGHLMARCRMYRSASEVWEGFTKNLFEGLGESVTRLVLVLALHLWAFVLPLVLLVAADGPLRVAGAIGVGANVVQRAILVLRHRQPVLAALAQPISVLALVAIGLESWRRSITGRIAWRGRRYGARSARGA